MTTQNDLLKRIAALNGQPLENVPAEDVPAPVPIDLDVIRKKIRRERTARDPRSTGPVLEELQGSSARTRSPLLYRRDLPQPGTQPSSTLAPGPSVTLAEAAQGVEVEHRRGRALLLSQPAVSLLPDQDSSGTDFSQRFYRRFHPEPARSLQQMGVRCGLDRLCVEDLIFIDLETAGLGNAPIFLGGLMTWEGDGLVVSQYLARDYSEEAAVTALVAERIAGRRVLVSFNGKTFDLPFLRARAAANAVPFFQHLPHLDVLHEARRAWRRGLPDCRLQTLERYICGRRRQGDIEGRDVPDAYHAFVRTGNASQLAQILNHNALDLVTLAELLIQLPARAEAAIETGE